MSLCSCANKCVTRRQLQRLAIATGRVSHFPPLGTFPPAFRHSTSIVLNRLFSVTFSLHRTPCSIKLVDNPERDCYADVMALFDDEIMLFPKINCPLEINLNIYCRKCPCGTECFERQFLSRVLISRLPISLIMLLTASQVSTSTWPSGQYWQDLGLEFFDSSDLKVTFLLNLNNIPRLVNLNT